jgi:hypothetical protein
VVAFGNRRHSLPAPVPGSRRTSGQASVRQTGMER